MSYRIDFIATVAIGVLEEPGGRALAFTLQEGQRVPDEFQVGDPVEITIHPENPATLAMGHNRGYYEITHPASGKSIRTLHRDDEWKVK